jgi:hypothetical protein
MKSLFGMTPVVGMYKSTSSFRPSSSAYRILPMLKPAGSAAAEKLLTSLGVEIVKNQKVDSHPRGPPG